MDENMHTDTVM